MAALWVYATSGSRPASALEVLNNVLNTQYFSIFWFFPYLFGVYLAIPFVSLVPEELRRKGFGYAIVAGAATISVLPFVCGLVGLSWPGGLQFPAAGGYLLYALIGYWVARYEIPRPWRIALYAAGALGLAAHVFGTQVLSYEAGEIVGTFKGYLNVPCLFYSAAIFTAFRHLEGSALMRLADRTIGRLSGLAFGVYLLQGFCLQFVSLYTSINVYSLRYRLGGGLAIFALCCAVTWAIKKIPGLRRVMG